MGAKPTKGVAPALLDIYAELGLDKKKHVRVLCKADVKTVEDFTLLNEDQLADMGFTIGVRNRCMSKIRQLQGTIACTPEAGRRDGPRRRSAARRPTPPADSENDEPPSYHELNLTTRERAPPYEASVSNSYSGSMSDSGSTTPSTPARTKSRKRNLAHFDVLPEEVHAAIRGSLWSSPVVTTLRKGKFAVDLHSWKKSSDAILCGLAEEMGSRIQALSLSGARGFSPRGLTAIAQGCPSLARLDLYSAGVRAKDLKALDGLYLEELQLSHTTHVPSAALVEYLERNGKRLEVVSLLCLGRTVNDDVLFALAKHCPALEAVSLHSCGAISEKGLAELTRKAPVRLHGTPFDKTEYDTQIIRSFALKPRDLTRGVPRPWDDPDDPRWKIWDLFFEETPLAKRGIDGGQVVLLSSLGCCTDEVLEAIGTYIGSNLEGLDLRNCSGGCTELKRIDMYNIGMNDEMINALRGCALEGVVFSHATVSSKVLAKFFSGCSELQHVELLCLKGVNNRVIKALEACPELASLKLHGWHGVDDERLDALVDACPDITFTFASIVVPQRFKDRACCAKWIV